MPRGCDFLCLPLASSLVAERRVCQFTLLGAFSVGTVRSLLAVGFDSSGPWGSSSSPLVSLVRPWRGKEASSVVVGVDDWRVRALGAGPRLLLLCRWFFSAPWAWDRTVSLAFLRFLYCLRIQSLVWGTYSSSSSGGISVYCPACHAPRT